LYDTATPRIRRGLVVESRLPSGGNRILRVLVVDPDSCSLEATRRALEAGGLEVQTAGTSREAFELLGRQLPHLLIVELLLPDLSGLGFCRTIREEPRLARLPIVMVTAANAEMDRVVAFEVGVDDFVAKPFHPRELALRVRAILRRTLRSAGEGDAESLLRFRGLSLDPQQRSVHVESKPIALTAKEFDVLATLMRHAGRVLARKQILEEVWGGDSGKTVRVVDTHVKWIRRKLGPSKEFIETLRGVGYRFADLRVEDPSARVTGSVQVANAAADPSKTRPPHPGSQDFVSPAGPRPPV